MEKLVGHLYKKPGSIVQNNGKKTSKAFPTGPTITGSEYKDLGSRLISKEGLLAASHCRLCSQMPLLHSLGAEEGGQDGQYTLVESLRDRVAEP